MNQITPYSYQRGDYVYLEEDCDAGTFRKAVEQHGEKFDYRNNYADKRSKIRSYAGFALTGQETA